MAEEITRPGVYDIDEDTYHADPVPGGSLSSSGARRLLPPSCPAVYAHERGHGQAPRRAWDLGTAAHREVLGRGASLEVIDAPDYRTKAAQAARDEAREEGRTPLLAHEHEQVQAMAAALRSHPVAGPLLSPGAGRAEQTLVWQDPETRVVCRARLDHMPHPTSGRMIIADYKTAASAAPDKIGRAVADHGYHVQAAWYSEGVRALKLAEDAAFLFVFQEKTAPYLVTVAELDFMALDIGAALGRLARTTYADCVRTGRWPGYHDDAPASISLPAWVERTHEEITR